MRQWGQVSQINQLGILKPCPRIQAKHANEVALRLAKAMEKKLNLFSALKYDARIFRVHEGIESVVMSLLFFIFVENKVIGKHFNHASIFQNKLMKLIH